MKPDIKEQWQKLVDQIRYHDTLYYVYGDPEMSDTDYDKLFKQLQALEKKHPELAVADSPTQRVGGQPVDKLRACQHLVPMLSIANGFDLKEMEQFHQRMQAKLGKNIQYCVDYKIDGCALTLIYENGVLARALTRGDGAKGDDITHNARNIRGVPAKLQLVKVPGQERLAKPVDLSGTVEIRGEAFISNEDFIAVRDQQVADKADKLFANARNAAAGAIRSLNPTECWKRKVRFVAHGLGQMSKPIDDSYSYTMYVLGQLGVPTIEGASSPMTWEAAALYIDQMIKLVPQIDYPIDGIVIKVDSQKQREQLGQTSTKNVSWALAYKWERYEAETTVKRIEVQVGKKGTLTPVAYFEPVEIAETMVKKSTLHNFDEVKRLDIRVGDRVIVEKAGKIIPRVVRVLKEKRTNELPAYKAPDTCPQCGSKVKNYGAYLRCINPLSCTAQLHAIILSAADRSRLDIEGLGEIYLTQMMEAGLITKLTDLWRLKDRQSSLLALQGFGKGRVTKLLAAIERARERPVARLLASLNIEHCGRTVSAKIMKQFKTLDKLATAKMADLQEIEGVGSETASSVVAWFQLARNKKIIEEFRQLGVNLGERDPKSVAVKAKTTGALVGKKVCATGTLEGYTRQSIQEAIQRAGGVVADSVSKTLDYLVVGDKAGSKLQKAQSLGVKTLTEQEFNKLVAS